MLKNQELPKKSLTDLPLIRWLLNRFIDRLFFLLVRPVIKSKKVENIYWNYIHGFYAADASTLLILEKCFKKAKELGIANLGDYYEFGVFKGYTFWYAQKLADKLFFDKILFFGFDSFKGLPKIKGIDKAEYYSFYEGEFVYSKDKVIINLNSKGINWNKSFLIEGFFEDTLNDNLRKKYKMNKVAIALIDCDLYSSTVEVLRFIESMIMDKTILIFDDYHCFKKEKERGERKAFDEFLKRNKNLKVEEFTSLGTGKAFIIHKDG